MADMPSSDASSPSPSDDTWAALCAELDVSDPDDVLDHVRFLNREQEVLEEAGVSDATEAVHTINRLRNENQRLQNESPAERETGGNGAVGSDPGTLPGDIEDVLGIRTAEDARALEARIDDMTARLDHLDEEFAKLEARDLNVDGAIAMIDSMSDQLRTVYHGDGAPPASRTAPSLPDDLRHRAADRVGADPDSTDASSLVRQLTDHVDALSDEVGALEEAGLGANEALAMLESMEAQLDDLYQAREGTRDAARQLSDIEDVLGISTREEAEELAQVADDMERQLQAVYREKEKLEPLGLTTIDEAVDMIESMEQQLDELYEEKEAARDVRPGSLTNQSTFQQLQDLYAEQERLQKALGVSSAEEIIEMVEGLSTQLDELYTERDREREAISFRSLPSDVGSPDAPHDSLERQLEALYREKETLLHHGFATVEEAVRRLETQQKQLEALRRENHTYEERLNRIEAELGTRSVSQLVEAVHTLASEADRALDDLTASAGGAPPFADARGPEVHAAPPVLEADARARLPSMTAAARDELDAGVVHLTDDGTVQSVNTAALQMPPFRGMEREAVVGADFFGDVAPSTNSALFRGRIEAGRQHPPLDARFPYTFMGAGTESTLRVHLYRLEDHEGTWLLFRPA